MTTPRGPEHLGLMRVAPLVYGGLKPSDCEIH